MTDYKHHELTLNVDCSYSDMTMAENKGMRKYDFNSVEMTVTCVRIVANIHPNTTIMRSLHDINIYKREILNHTILLAIHL